MESQLGSQNSELEAERRAKAREENRREAEKTDRLVKSFMENPKAQKLFDGTWRPSQTSLLDRAHLRAMFRPIAGDRGARIELGVKILRSEDEALRGSHHFLQAEMHKLSAGEPLFKQGEVVRAPIEEIPDVNFSDDFLGHKDAADGWQVGETDAEGNVVLRKVTQFANSGEVNVIGEPIVISELALASSNNTASLSN